MVRDVRLSPIRKILGSFAVGLLGPEASSTHRIARTEKNYKTMVDLTDDLARLWGGLETRNFGDVLLRATGAVSRKLHYREAKLNTVEAVKFFERVGEDW